MNIEMKKELEESLETIAKGCCQKMGEFVIGGLKNGRLQVDGYLPYNTISEIPKATIQKELQLIKEKFSLLMNQSQIFKDYALNVGIDYYLVLDTGNAGIAICTEIEGVYNEFI
jgi:hypothetical protein